MSVAPLEAPARDRAAAVDWAAVAQGLDAQGWAVQNAMVFQESGLFPWMTVTANVGFGLMTRGVPAASVIQATTPSQNTRGGGHPATESDHEHEVAIVHAAVVERVGHHSIASAAGLRRQRPAGRQQMPPHAVGEEHPKLRIGPQPLK